MKILKTMTGRVSIFGGFLAALLLAVSLFAQEETEPQSPAETDLLMLFEQVNAKIEAAGRPSDPAGFFAAAVAAFAELRAKYVGKKSKKRLDHLVGLPAPELDFTWSTAEGLEHLSDLSGKVVVLDFWATWCGPCVRSFPQVRELTEHYADSAVEVVGVTSLQGRVHGLERAPIDVRNDPAKEHALMNEYIAKMGINWTIAFSEQEVFNPDYGVTGIPHMAIIAPDGTVRHTDLHPAMPHDQKLEMIDALLKEFDLPVPEHS